MFLASDVRLLALVLPPPSPRALAPEGVQVAGLPSLATAELIVVAVPRYHTEFPSAKCQVPSAKRQVPRAKCQVTSDK